MWKFVTVGIILYLVYLMSKSFMRRMYDFTGRDYDDERRKEKQKRRSRFMGGSVKSKKEKSEVIDIDYEEID